MDNITQPLMIKDSKGNPLFSIGQMQLFHDAVDGDYYGYWIHKEDEKYAGEGMAVRADKLVKLISDFYEKEF